MSTASSQERIALNNQVILMRKFVKQAKIHIINKLVKNLTAHQKKHRKEAQLQKFERKNKRLLNEIKFIKQMKPDDISKIALSETKDWKALLLDKKATLEERSIAMLVNFDSVQMEVKKYHFSNPHVLPRIGIIFEAISAKKAEMLKLSNKNAKGVKKYENAFERFRKTSAKKLPSAKMDIKTKITEVKPKTIAKIESPKMETDSNFKKINTTEKTPEKSIFKNIRSNEANKPKVMAENDKPKIEVVSELKTSATKKIPAKNMFKNMHNNEVNKTKPATKIEKQNDSLVLNESSSNRSETNSSLKVIIPLNLSELQSLEQIPIGADIPYNTIENNNGFKKSRNDPFFLGNNEEHCTEAIKSTKVESVSTINKRLSDLADSKPFHNFKMKNQREKFHNRNSPYSHKECDKFNEKDRKNNCQHGTGNKSEKSAFSNVKEKSFGFRNNRNDRFKTFEKKDFTVFGKLENKKLGLNSNAKKGSTNEGQEETNLHPSWAAKRRLKQTMTTFQGKRTVFDD